MYHVRAYATNSAGTAYGADLSFTTSGQIPEALTQSATNISGTVATLNGTVDANYLPTTVTFEYGTTTSYGQTITATQSPVSGNSLTNVSSETTVLEEGTTYHFRVKTENSLGIAFGNNMTFTTLGQAPTAITQPACCLSSTGAILNGSVNANYAVTTVTFEYGTTTAYGSSVSAAQNPIAGNISASVSAHISGLNTGKLCPAGWHIPAYSEWLELMSFLGGGNEAYGRQIGGRLLKESGSFFNINTNGNWWASGLWWAGGDNGTNFMMANDSEGVTYGSAAKNTGASIRCLKD